MRVYLVTTPIGVFALSPEMEVLGFKPFPRDASSIAQRYGLAQTQLIPEEEELMEELRTKGYEEFVFATKKPGFRAEPGNPAQEFIAQNLRSLAIELKFVKDEAELNRLLTRVGIELARAGIRKAIERDKLVIHTIRAIEELERVLNTLVERLRSGYGLHFPEMEKAVRDHIEYARIVREFGLRKNIAKRGLAELARRSVGAELREEDVQQLQGFASLILQLHELRQRYLGYLEDQLREIAPNLTELAGPVLAAKLISAAGGMERLAKSPSSTLQLLGSEKALFRHLRGKARPPKHGYLFIHPLIQKAPKKLRGKIARALASKLAIAVRIDYYTKEDRSAELKKDLERKLKAIRAKARP